MIPSPLPPWRRVWQTGLRAVWWRKRHASSDPSVLLHEDRSQRNQQLVALIRSLGASPAGQLEALERAQPSDLQQMPYRRLLDEIAKSLPRDVGEKVSWDLTGRLAETLKKLNAQSLHQRLGLRLNNALLQDSHAQLPQLISQLCGTAMDGYGHWILNQKFEERLDSLEFVDLVTWLHAAPEGFTGSETLRRHLRRRVRSVADGVTGVTGGTWAKLLQICEASSHAESQSSSASSTLQAWEVLDAIKASDIAGWSLPQLAALGSSLQRSRSLRHASLAEALLDAILQKEDSDVELMVLSFSGALALHTPKPEVATKCFSRLMRLSTDASCDAAQLLCLALRVMVLQSEMKPIEVSKSLLTQEVSATLITEILCLASKTFVRFTGDDEKSELPQGESPAELLSALRPVVAQLEASAVQMAPSLPGKDFSELALALARLGLGSGFLESGDLEARLASAFHPASLPKLAWAMAALEASEIAWSLLSLQLRDLKGDLHASDQALLFEALASQAIVSPALANYEQVWRGWEEIWLSKMQMPRSTHFADLAELLPEMGEECTQDATIGQSPWSAPVLFVEKKIILDLLPTARHPASGTTRGDVQLKHNTWAESGYTVLVIPDKQWVKAAAEGEEGKSKSKWIKGKVEQLHKQFYIQNAGVQDSEVQTLLMSLKLGKTGINTDALNRLTALPVANQKRALQKFRNTRRDWVKNDSAWLIGIIKEEQSKPAESEQTDPEAAQTAMVSRPKEGWNREGRSLQQVKVGERLSGKVTNIWKDRVWVDVGLQKDASFIWKGDIKEISVGQTFRTIKVKRVDQKRDWVEVEPIIARNRSQSASPRFPLSNRPVGGWKHQEGKLLAELQIGETVTGKVTNVLRDRVWVNIGAEADVTFTKPKEEKLRVGDTVTGTIVEIDLKRRINNVKKEIVRIKRLEG